MTNSVWVCSRRNAHYEKKEHCAKHRDRMCFLNSSSSNFSHTPCDAVEYAEVKKPCKWTVDGDGVWYTECGDAFVFDSGGPTDNKFKVCPYCGGALMEEKQ